MDTQLQGYRLSPQQRRLFERSAADGAGAFRVQASLRVDGPLDEARLRAAATDAVARHEALRTSFQRLPGMELPLQVVGDVVDLPWPQAVEPAPGAPEDEALERLLESARRAPAAAGVAPLRLDLVRFGPERHALLLTAPAVSADAGSLDLLAREIARGYAGTAGEGDDPLQYVDASEWLNELLESAEAAEGRRYWAQLRGAAADARLPWERADAEGAPFDPRVVRLDLPAALSARIADAARERGVPAAAFVLAGWQVLLARLTGEASPAAAVAYDGRHYAELAGAVGPFARYVPFPFRHEPARPFSAVLAEVAARYAELETWQEYFSWDDFGAERAAGERFFPFAFEAARGPSSVAADGGRIDVVPEFSCTDRSVARLRVADAEGGMAAELYHDASRLAAGDAERLGDALLALLADAADAPDRAAGDLEIVGGAERRRLEEWGGTGRPLPSASVPERIAAQAARTPDAVAVTGGGRTLTCAELDAAAERLAVRLRAAGVGPEEIVALHLPRSPDFVVAILAAWKAGGAYLPLDPAWPAERVAALLASARPRAVVTAGDGADALAGVASTIVRIDAVDAGEDHVSAGPAPSVSPENLAYVLFTSGSTGTPKAVAVEHRQLAGYVDAAVAALELEEAESFALVSTFAADLGHTALFPALCLGRALHVVPADAAADPGALAAEFAKAPAGALKIVPSHLGALLADRRAAILPRARLVLGGEALPWGLVDAVRALAPGCRIFNHYGPTETTVGATVYPVDPDARPDGAATVPIGRPLGGARVRVLDERMRAVPAGVPGELYIGGAGVARGYLGRPGATAERFVPDPSAPGARMYRTGDRVRFLAGGALEFLGRRDHQVKVRGFRVEPGEVEAALEEHPGVERAVVVPLGEGGELRLAAYVVPGGPAAAVRRFAQMRRAPATRRLAWHELPNGLTVFHLNPGETDYLYRGIFEEREYFRHGIALPEDATVFDVGANIGLFSLLAARLSPGARIFAVEPLPPIAEILRANAQLHGLNARVVEAGLGREEGRATFAFYPHLSLVSGRYPDREREKEVVRAFVRDQLRADGGAGLSDAALEELLDERLAARDYPAEIRTLSSLIREHGVERIDLLKVDVQRSELEVLAGIADHDWPKIRRVVMEVQDVDGEVERIASILRGRGFGVRAELASSPEAAQYLLYAVREGEPAVAPARAAENGPEWSHPEALVRDARRFLAARLPEHMVPAHLVALDALPLTANGKVDRAALPAPEREAGRAAVRTAPRTAAEEVLAAIWCEVLGTDAVGTDEDFFALGGHSLMATRVIARVREAFGAELPLRAFFDAPTVAALARAVEALRGPGAAPAAPPVVPVPRDGPPPLSFAQRRLWFIDQLEPGSAVYNVPVALRLRGELDDAALVWALGEVVRRHEVLRTTFGVDADGEPVQVIGEARPVPLPVVDLSAVEAPAREALAGRLAREEAARPFDLARGPVLRCALLRLGAADSVFLFTMHHSASDDASAEILVREVSALYGARVAGGSAGLPDLPVQYADYAVWQRRWLEGEALERQIAYWRGRLAGAPTVLELPTDRPRPAVAGDRGGVIRFAVPAAAAAKLREVGRREGATLFMTLLAAWQALLARYGAGDDVVVGTPVAGRTRRETEGLIGFFVNMLMIRTGVEGDPAFRELVGRVREGVLEAQAHQDLPFERLVEAMEVERSLAHTPLFQVVFTLENPRGPVGLPGIEAERLDAGAATTTFDLVLRMADEGGSLAGHLTYRTDLFDAATAERVAGHFVRLLEGVADDPGLRLSAVELMDGAERRRVLEEWNATEREYPRDLCVHQLFEAQAARTPHAAAVELGGEVLSYAELEAQANRLARRLRRMGVGPETVVALCVDRTPDLVVGILGILKAGGAYLPLDPAYPPERLRYMREDSGARVLVAQRALLERAGAEALADDRLLLLDDAGLAAEDDSRVATGVRPENLAYVVYTSGSTGQPKGAAIRHASLVNYLTWFGAEVLGGAAYDLPLISRLSFDAAVRQIYPPLLSGGRVRLLPEAVLREPVDLAKALDGRERLVFGGVPSLWAMLMEQVEAGDADLPGLEKVLLGGEALSEELVARTLARFPGVEIWNHYGPTEATVNTTAARIDGTRPIGLGRPIANVRLYVVDGAGRPVPAGVPGELLVGGEGLARGYLGRPGLTAERFVPDPFGAEPGGRLYRSGDRVRWTADGELEFVGRVDEQVKVRGYRVEPGEIEGALRRHPAVREAAVVARDGGLVAYVVAEGDWPGADALRAHLAGRLPDYMVPGAFVALEALPLSPNGKVDRRALPAPVRDATEDGADAAPRTPAEEVLAGIWCEVLGVERIGAEENFFELGGHSLSATRVVSRARKAFGVELPLRALFEEQTVRALAARVDALRGSAPEADAPPVVPVSRDGELPLSFAQQRLWFLHQLEPESAAYNVPVALRMRGRLDAGALSWAIAEVARRHEVLRTTFRMGADGEPVQVIGEPAPVPLAVVDLSGVGAAEREAEVERRMREEAARPFDLAHGPVLRCTLLRLGAEEAVGLFTLHHIVSDEWSAGLLVGEISALYAARVRGEDARLPDLPVQYADYAAWQRERLQGEVLERQLGYWRERLAGAPAVIDLPTDRPRPAVASERGGAWSFAVSPRLAAALREVGRREGATLFMTLLAAWQALLARYGAGEDVVVGTPVAGRTRLETEGLIGFFVNMLVIRTGVERDATFREVLGRVRENVLGAQAHQELPFERLMDELAVERTLAHTPLFQVMFAFQSPVTDRLALEGLELEPLPAESGATPYDLSLVLGEEGEGLSGALEYRADLFDPSTAERMAGHLVRLLEAVAADPDARLWDVDLLDEAERRRVVEEWNAAEPPSPRGRCLHELFEQQVARTRGAAAVVWEGGSLTYRELNTRANRMARYLRRLGVGAEVVVAVCLERSPEMIIAMLAVMKAGGAFLPLDPAYPRERLLYLLEDSGARVLLTDTALRERLEDGMAPRRTMVLCVDEKRESIARRPAWNPHGRVGSRNLAYVIYTSGSTGRPKGVAVEHGSASGYAAEMARLLELGEGERMLQFASPGFDVVIEEVFPALVSGAAVVVSRAELLQPAELARVIDETSVSVMELPTAYWHEWVRAMAEDGLRLPATLRRVLMGGERVLPERLRQWREIGCELVHVFGLTETTVTTSIHRLPAGQAGEGELPIGRPIASQRVYVLDEGFRPVPVGVPGEMYIGGEGVARGYLRRAALTADRFVPDPFSADRGARLYRTGDRARWREDGELEFLGRVDEQVKVRGYRIEPGEIESVLAGHPAVGAAVVVAREDAPGDRRLVAYVVARDGSDPRASELRAHLSGRLPDYMVPGSFVVVDRLPLTPNGKVDRRALPAPEHDPSRDEAYVAPRTPAEEVLAEIWAEVLGLERVGVEENFFALGGHSLVATRVTSRAREALGVELPLRALFEAQTVAGLAARVDALRGSEAGVEAPPIVPVPRDGELPLSFAQQRLWFIDQLEPGSAAYNVSVALRLRGALDAEALAWALSEVVRRHEVLRTTFATVDGRPVQVIGPAGPVRLPVADLSNLGPRAREAAVERLARAEAARPFDLARGPVLRCTLLRLAPAEAVGLFTLHHIVSDEWSAGLLVREVSALYAARVRGEDADLPDLPVQYADYAAWQRDRLRSDVLDRQLAYWRERLAGAPAVIDLPTDRPRAAVAGERGARHAFALSPELSRALRAVGRREGATLFMTLLAAWQALLARYGAGDDIVVGAPVAGRTRLETEGLIGFFVNMLVIRTGFEGDPTFREALARVRERVLEAHANQEVPFERLVDELAAERSLAHTPLFQVVFSLDPSAGEEELRLGAVEIEPLELEGGTAKFDLALGVAESGGRLQCSLKYRTALFDASTVERMSGHLVRLLEAVAADPDARLSGVEVLDDAERRRMLEEWNATERAYPRDLCVHQLFEAQAARTPLAAAVELGGEVLSYGELEARANRLARRLRRMGVGPEAVVAVCLDRTPDLVVAVLAVLKAGGAYLPLDPAYPPERLRYMREDSGARVLVAERALLERAGAEALADDRVLLLDADDAGLEAEDDSRVATGVRPENLAYVVYTSGSTGQPKGAAIRHGSLVNYLTWFGAEVLGGGSYDLPLISRLSFDAAVRQIYPPLLSGGRVRLLPEEVLREPAELAKALDGRERLVFGGVPSLWAMLMEQVEAGDADLPGLEKVLLGGEALSEELVGRTLARFPGVEIWNHYGPTEATVNTTVARIDGTRPVGLGRPIANVRLYVVDRGMRPVPAGVPGELLVGGEGLARGYLGRPALTAERFVPDPFGSVPGGRLYRSGDRVRRRADGELEFVGRVDEQVKVRGYRVEPGEVEGALRRHPAVRDAAVAVRGGALVAYVVAEGDWPGADALRAHLAGGLPDYMVPGAFVALEALPLSPNGKVDRRALPAPEGGAEPGARYVAPRSAVEEVLAMLLADLLGIERVGVEDDFFSLGGHSLTATQFVTRIRQTLQVELPLRALFEEPTVAGLARVIVEREREPGLTERMARIVLTVLSMSDDEVRQAGAAAGLAAAGAAS
jgi:amino acid adenylation domain-containing protein/FkbM family methyltransferase